MTQIKYDITTWEIQYVLYGNGMLESANILRNNYTYFMLINNKISNVFYGVTAYLYGNIIYLIYIYITIQAFKLSIAQNTNNKTK